MSMQYPGASIRCMRTRIRARAPSPSAASQRQLRSLSRTRTRTSLKLKTTGQGRKDAAEGASAGGAADGEGEGGLERRARAASAPHAPRGSRARDAQGARALILGHAGRSQTVRGERRSGSPSCGARPRRPSDDLVSGVAAARADGSGEPRTRSTRELDETRTTRAAGARAAGSAAPTSATAPSCQVGRGARAPLRPRASATTMDGREATSKADDGDAVVRPRTRAPHTPQRDAERDEESAAAGRPRRAHVHAAAVDRLARRDREREPRRSMGEGIGEGDGEACRACARRA